MFIATLITETLTSFKHITFHCDPRAQTVNVGDNHTRLFLFFSPPHLIIHFGLRREHCQWEEVSYTRLKPTFHLDLWDQ